MSTKHRKSSMGRSRDFGTEGAGKGDGDRVTDVQAYRENYDEINWGPSENRPVRFFWDGLECLPIPPNAIINPAWVTAPIGIDELVPPYAALDIGPDPKNGHDGDSGVAGAPVVLSNSSGVPPDPALEDFESWDR